MSLDPALHGVEFDRAGRHLTIYLTGELDVAVAADIEGQVLRQHRRDDEKVWVDLSDVTFCDSSGIGMLCRLHLAIEEQGTHFVLCNPRPNVRRLLDIVDPRGTLKIRTA